MTQNDVKSNLFQANTKRISHLLIPLLFLSLLFFLVLNPASVSAQSGDDPAASQEITANEVNAVAEELWCPLCSGVRLDACELKACDQMKDVIAIKLSEGESTENIKDYFLDQYGPQVLGEPPREGFNWLAWIMPFAVLFAGGIFLWFRARNMVGSGVGMEPVSTPGAKPTGSQQNEKKDYDRKLEEELNRYG